MPACIVCFYKMWGGRFVSLMPEPKELLNLYTVYSVDLVLIIFFSMGGKDGRKGEGFG